MIPIEHDGTLYVVSTRGEAEWVRNVRAAGALRLGQKGDLTTYRAEEVPVERAVGHHRGLPGQGRPGGQRLLAKLPADADHPVFRLTR